MGLTRNGKPNHGSYVDLSKSTTNEKHILENLDNVAGRPKTKIVCTLGPVSRDVPKLETLLRAGMSIARFNFSHGSHEYHQETLDNLRVAMKNTGIRCGVLLDTKGPEIRTGMLKNGGPVMLEKDQEITLTTDYEMQGDEHCIAVSYKSMPTDVSPGSQILCADGSITFTVIECNPAAGTVKCRCENSAKLGERKNMNLPGVIVDLPTITEKDRDDLLQWGVPNKVDFIAASFVRKGSDLDFIRNTLGDAAKNISIISKVENMEGLDNFDAIVDKSDGVMVARGDLGMEIRMEQIFLAQKRMIKRCNEAGKPVVTATQMLESMTGAPRPTRAEATDVANAVLDGTDAVMLSGETAAGSYPVEAVSVMHDICKEAEAYVDNFAVFKQLMDHQEIPMSTLESLASSAVRSAHKVMASLIVVLGESGNTARLIAKYRPSVPIFMMCIGGKGLEGDRNHDPEQVARRSLSMRGVISEVAEKTFPTPKENLAAAIQRAKEMGLCKAGDRVVGVHRVDTDAIMKIVECE